MKKHKVLIVEVNGDIARILIKHLQVKGYEVLHLSNGLDVLALLLKEDEPSAVILDLMTPGRSGIELLGSIKAKWSNKASQGDGITASIRLDGKVVSKEPVGGTGKEEVETSAHAEVRPGSLVDLVCSPHRQHRL